MVRAHTLVLGHHQFTKGCKMLHFSRHLLTCLHNLTPKLCFVKEPDAQTLYLVTHLIIVNSHIYLFAEQVPRL